MSGSDAKKGLDPLRNPLDPLHNVAPQGRALFVELYKVIEARPRRDVLDAMTNLLVNILREVDDTQAKANNHVDAFAAACKHLLSQHYDNAGKRRNIFPHHQIVDVGFLGDLTKGLKN